MSDLRDVIKEQRDRAGLTRARLGAAVGLSSSSIAHFEQGRGVPQPDTAKRLDELFDTGDQIQRAVVEARNDSRPTWLLPWTQNEERATISAASSPT